jgi:hypothetical protein
MTQTKSTSGNDNSTSLDLEWEDGEEMIEYFQWENVPEQRRDDILWAALWVCESCITTTWFWHSTELPGLQDPQNQ